MKQLFPHRVASQPVLLHHLQAGRRRASQGGRSVKWTARLKIPLCQGEVFISTSWFKPVPTSCRSSSSHPDPCIADPIESDHPPPPTTTPACRSVGHVTLNQSVHKRKQVNANGWVKLAEVLIAHQASGRCSCRRWGQKGEGKARPLRQSAESKLAGWLAVSPGT